MKLENKDHKKVAVITGASSGIGMALVYLLASYRYHLVLVARTEDSLKKVYEELSGQGVSCSYLLKDVASADANKDIVQHVLQRYGSLDLFIANAGITMKGWFTEVDFKVHQRVMDTNYWAVLYAAFYALPELKKTNGTFVAVSSIAGLKGLPGRTGYSASKHAVNGLIDCLQTENLNEPVHILLACPGFTNTNTRKSALMPDGSLQGETPREEGKMMDPEEVAKEIYNAVLKKKRRIILTKQGRLIYILDKIAPEFLRKKIFASFAAEPNSPLR